MSDATQSTTTGRERLSDRPIVVGIDGSEESLAALAFAFEEAELRDAELHVVYAWSFPTSGDAAYQALVPSDRQQPQRDAEATAAAYVKEFLAGRQRPLWLKTDAIEGYPPTVLLDRAGQAQMLVVGSRGRGGFKGLLLGSVSSACVHHAPCPVAVVPDR